MSVPASLVRHGTQVIVQQKGGEPAWLTAVIAVGSALLGSTVGGYASFRASEAMEIRRRRARAQLRRKAKVYADPHRAAGASGSQKEGRILGYWGIMREPPPGVMRQPASIYHWRQLVEDGRAQTAASDRVRDLLNTVEARVDRINGLAVKLKEVFTERAEAILAELGESPKIQNWVDSDVEEMVAGRFDDLGLLGTRYGEAVSDHVAEKFEATWKADEAIREVLEEARQADRDLAAALDTAIAELDRAMRSIARRYEHESPKD